MPLIPRPTCICPSCMEEIDLLKCDIVSGVTTGKVLKKASGFQLTLEPLQGPFYTQESAHRRCPRPQCGYLLPYNIERVMSISLSVVGDVYSGKSHYIASLMRQLRYEWVNATGGTIELECLTPEVEKDFRDRYLSPLYHQSKPLNQTPQALVHNPNASQSLVDHPLIYKIRVSDQTRSPAETFNLMIYDTSGEDFRQVDRLVRFARFAFKSSAFMFMADPFSMEKVYNELPSNLRAMVPLYAQPDKRHPTSELISQFLSTFRRHERMGDISRLAHIPIAVLVSKADLFTKAVHSYPYTYLFDPAQRPTYTYRADLQDIDAMDTEVRRLLGYYQENNLLRVTSRLAKVKFFATSATSVPPDRPDHFPSVTPWRCLDPVLWIFHELGIIRGA